MSGANAPLCSVCCCSLFFDEQGLTFNAQALGPNKLLTTRFGFVFHSILWQFAFLNYRGGHSGVYLEYFEEHQFPVMVIRTKFH